MRPLGGTRLTALALVAAATLACQEQLTQPGQCPELCPGGSPDAVEEVLQATPSADSAFSGYALRAGTGILLVASGVPSAADTNLAIYRFSPRVDTVRFRDTVRTYTVDSVVLTLNVVGRDTAARAVQLQLYKLPSTLDTAGLTYAGVRGLLSAAAFIEAPLLPDTLRNGSVQAVIKGADLAKVTLDPSDGGRLTLGVLVTAPTFTGVRLGGLNSDVSPIFSTYVTPDAPNPGTTSLRLSSVVEFNTYLRRNETTPDPAALAVGGGPAVRSLIRFPWPAKLRDSVSLVRATLELTPIQPTVGLKNDAGRLEARVLLTDFGAKSPTLPTLSITSAVPPGTDTVVKVEVVRLVQLWQGTNGRPPALLLDVTPEAASFTEAVFGSTRVGTAPRLRITYLNRFPFERP